VIALICNRENLQYGTSAKRGFCSNQSLTDNSVKTKKLHENNISQNIVDFLLSTPNLPLLLPSLFSFLLQATTGWPWRFLLFYLFFLFLLSP
jgi:hypothetical protein